MRRITTAVAAAGLMLTGCATDPPSEDQAACDAYDSTIDDVNAGTIDEAQLFDQLEAAWIMAGSDRLDDLLDDLLHYMEAENRVDQDTVHRIRSWCNLD